MRCSTDDAPRWLVETGLNGIINILLNVGISGISRVVYPQVFVKSTTNCIEIAERPWSMVISREPKTCFKLKSGSSEKPVLIIGRWRNKGKQGS